MGGALPSVDALGPVCLAPARGARTEAVAPAGGQEGQRRAAQASGLSGAAPPLPNSATLQAGPLAAWASVYGAPLPPTA